MRKYLVIVVVVASVAFLIAGGFGLIWTLSGLAIAWVIGMAPVSSTRNMLLWKAESGSRACGDYKAEWRSGYGIVGWVFIMIGGPISVFFLLLRLMSS